ncbi:MAG: hypothetical protein ABSD73_10065 [Candidatus Bathyarchaeia archaeon]|jgi:hypothetical protein
MNKKLFLAGLLAISVIALGTASFAGAQLADYYPGPVNYTITKWIVIWYFKTVDQYGGGSFDGRTVIKSTVTAYALDATGNYKPVKPLCILTTKDYVMLIFLPSALPAHNTDGSSAVTGTLTNGQTFDATGPGWSLITIH